MERRERLKKVQQSLYALLLELGLVATKESIKNAHNLGRSESVERQKERAKIPTDETKTPLSTKPQVHFTK